VLYESGNSHSDGAKKDFWYLSWLADHGFKVYVTPLDNPFRTGEQFSEEQAEHASRVLEDFKRKISFSALS